MKRLKDRIKDIRKSQNLTQEEFANKIGCKRNTVATWETGKGGPNEAFIRLILKEFNLNEEWLRTGEGEMLKAVPKEDEYFKAATELSIHGDDMAMQAVIEYWKLDEDSKKLLKDFILHIVEEIKDKE